MLATSSDNVTVCCSDSYDLHALMQFLAATLSQATNLHIFCCMFAVQ